MKKMVCPLWKNMKVGDKSTQPSGFYFTLKGRGVYGNEVLFGTNVELIFHIPALALCDSEVSLDFCIIPYGFSLLENSSWTQTVQVPCGETEVSFSLCAPTGQQWRNSIKSGFAFSLFTEALTVYQEWIPVRLIKTHPSSPKSYVNKIGFDLEKEIKGINNCLREWHEKLKKTEFVEE